MIRVARDVPLPDKMQGRWADADDLSSELIIAGGEITCFGCVVEYDFKDIKETGGALNVNLKL